MFNYIDRKLSSITMYRLVMYYLMAILFYAVILSNLGYLKYDSFFIIVSVAYITFFSWVTNIFFSKIFKAPINLESVYITALILVFVITPPKSFFDLYFLLFAFLSSVFAIASKYIFAIKKKHIFNPVAVGIFTAGIVSGQAASWWIGNVYMVPVVIIFGVLLLRKILRFELVGAFLGVFIISILSIHQYTGFLNMINFANKALFYSPVLFFAFVMLTEPLTSPTTRWMRMFYGAIVGILFDPFVHVGTLYFTPEMALLIGNIFSYIVSPKIKLVLELKEKIRVAFNTYEFVFLRKKLFSFHPGQYMEWTLPHSRIDNRGNRRYFTISSSPTEREVKIGVKFYSKASSFKKSLISMKVGDTISATAISGDFILPRNINKKLVFIAGGIGITPFRSMIKSILDRKEHRDIVLLYSNKSVKDIAYIDLLNEAKNFGIKIKHVITDTSKIPSEWKGCVGYIDAKMIIKEIPDYKERTFYLSGPPSMVKAEQKIFSELGVKKKQIKLDFFPGFI